MNARHLLAMAGVVLFVALFFMAQKSAEESLPLKPNILLILADDMGWGDSTVFNPDSKISMPALEQLAAQGMRFTDAHTTPKCAPTRYTVMTGNYQWRGLKSWGQWLYLGGSQILDGQMTLGSLLAEDGYKTAIIGKLHLGGDFYIKDSDNFAQKDTPEELIDFSRPLLNGPLAYGFDYSYLALRGIQDSPYAFFGNDQLVGDAGDLIIWQEGIYGSSTIARSGIGMPYWNSSQVGPILAQKAIEFIERHHQKNLADGTAIPFFLLYASQAAHGPYTPPNEFLGEPISGVTGMGARFDMIYEIDVALAKLVEALDQRELTGNTLIIFTSDNGARKSQRDIDDFDHDHNGGLRGHKGEIWEGGHRVPFVARWGDGTPAGSVIPPGTVNSQLIAVQDLMTTLADLVGYDLPVDQALDSVSFLPALLGEEVATEAAARTYFIMEAREVWDDDEGRNVYVPPHFALREGAWKLILDGNDSVLGLYNLDADLDETTNLMDDPSQVERIDRMRTLLLQRYDRDRDGINDDMDNCFLKPNGTVISDAGGHSQRDSDEDGYGNVCDGDLDNSGMVSFEDLALFKTAFGSSDPDADFNGDGAVSFGDLAIFKSMFFRPPGPSGLAP